MALNWQHRRYNMWSAYGESKLANLLFVAELARRGRRAYASDPGMTATDITRDGTGVLRWAGKTLARTSRRARLTGRARRSRPSPPTCLAEHTSRRGAISPVG
ncbi:retinol dehydrogenase 12 domain protein [Mycobacterium xenopi 4042]|uniref:Retinol dehydrogenase 12 domain protein n=1 Tax=Mycobacterium xenopi 4042 TaxID=1299334 RepID=X8AHQ6_MYCXE|nr:retinol dehydrogenase 12 domain protein [Mycobacterium xenopi 4042]